MEYRIDEDSLRQRAKRLKLMAFDVDGIMTDGRLIFSAQGEELKVFNVLDGHGLKALQSDGVKLAIITGRNSLMVEKRASDLGFDTVIQGRSDKQIALQELAKTYSLTADEIGYAGDDEPDVPALTWSTVAFSVPNAHRVAQAAADIITDKQGGYGAVRDMCDILLAARNGDPLP